MFNCCTVKTARSYGRLEKCINCKMNCGWINCIHKTGNYPVCHDSLSISDMGSWVHFNSHTCVNWLKIPSTEHLFYLQPSFSFPKNWQESWSWSLHQLCSLPILQHARTWGTRACGAPPRKLPNTDWQHCLGASCQCHSWELEVFLDWRSQTQLCAAPPLLLLRGTGEAGPD